MEILIFVLVIIVLIVVHELGHFAVAKFFGVRVDEFGLGYPPRALTLGKIGETEYTLNWLPFGGFVKIYGEDAVEQEAGAGSRREARSLNHKNRAVQALVLVAGIAMNLIFAYLLLTIALAAGTPRALTDAELGHATDIQLAVAAVLPGSPAALAGVQAGDTIVSATDQGGQWSASTASETRTFTDFVAASNGSPISLVVDRGGAQLPLQAAAREGVVPNEPSRYALGVSIAPIGIVPLSLPRAIVEGAQLTWLATKATAVGLVHFFVGLATFSADLSQVAGPVGIAGAVGSAAHQGWGDLFSIAALISINLALINLIPVPALDGGRLLFVAIETVTRRPIKPAVANALNSVGFALLILLMVVVTLHDVFRIVG